MGIIGYIVIHPRNDTTPRPDKYYVAIGRVFETEREAMREMELSRSTKVIVVKVCD